MFQRVLYENWHDAVPAVAFVLTFAVFVTAVMRALFADKAKADHMAALPLDEDKHGSCGTTCRRQCRACHSD